jgi:ribosomal protein L20
LKVLTYLYITQTTQKSEFRVLWQARTSLSQWS